MLPCINGINQSKLQHSSLNITTTSSKVSLFKTLIDIQRIVVDVTEPQIIMCHDLQLALTRGSHVKSDYERTIIRHTSLSPYMRHKQLISVVAPILHFTQSASCNGIPSLWYATKVRKGCPIEHRNQAKVSRETQSSTYAPGLATPSYHCAQPRQSSLCCPRPSSLNTHRFTFLVNLFQLFYASLCS